MKHFQAPLFFLALLGMMSFTGVPIQEETILETVTYGTCGCEGQVSTAPQVELTLNPDHTFHYTNAADPGHKLDLNGNWTMQGKRVVLTNDSNTKTRFHSSWKLDKNQTCIVSRKGLNFMRLCNVKACK